MTSQEWSQANSSPRGPGTLGELVRGQRGTRPPEAEWVALLQSVGRRDEAAFHLLYERTHRMVFTLMLRMTSSRDLAEELTVDVYHDVWRRAAAYDAGTGTVLGWIVSQARSRAIDRMRHDARQKRGGGVVVESLQQDTAVADAIPEPLEGKDRVRLLRTALGVLTTDERQALETAYFAGMPYREVAERLQQPLGTVKTRIRTALAKLRDALRTKGEAL